jgi:hypothetical protein
VVLYPFYWSVLTLVPDTWRLVTFAVVLALVVLAVAALVTTGVAVVRDHERSVLLLVVAALTSLLVLSFGVGEVLGRH